LVEAANFWMDGTNVGIGTSSPEGKLDINGHVYIRSYLDMNNNQIDSVNDLRFEDPGDQEGISWDGSAAKIFVGPLISCNGDGYLRLINDGGISFEGSCEDTTDMIIDPDGNIGIGTTNPQSKLAVSGLTESTGTNLIIDADGNVFKSSSSQRYKENIQPFNSNFEKILEVTPKSFTYKATGF
jgi:hypothetical protein